VTGLLFNKLRQVRSRSVRFADPESYLLFIGVALLGLYVGVHLHSLLFSRIALWRFDIAAVSAASKSGQSANQKVDVSLWAKTRVTAYHASLALKLEPAVAVLRIRRLHLTVPVFEGTDEIILNRGVGRILGTGSPGGDGNVAIAGHRDGFFRALKDIQLGDFVEIETPTERDTYIVEATRIVEPRDVSVLEPSPFASLTLVTCYPFYFIGDAPERFVVRGSLTHREFSQQARAVRQEQK
jgi:sortase A